MGACPFADFFLQMSASVEASVFVTSCDQMRRAADQAASRNGGEVFLMNVPATWQVPAARQLYRKEIERLGAFLVSIGGVPPSAEALAAELRSRTWEASPANRSTAEACKRVPLALIGESLMPSHFSLPGLLESLGGRVALDATSLGERGQPVFSDEARIAEDPFGTLVDGYFDSVADVFQRPNTRLYDWLRPRIAGRGIRGIVLWHYSWCDLWRAEANRLREEFLLPVLFLDADGSLTPSMKTRLEVFLEILRP